MSEGLKYDNDKERFDLIPPGPLFALAQVLTMGAKKYEDRNWEKGIKWGRLFGAAMRHLWKWWRGEFADVESGLPHLAHAACCIFFLMEYGRTHPELDDRPRFMVPVFHPSQLDGPISAKLDLSHSEPSDN